MRIFQVEDDRVDAVGVADEVVVQHVVVLVARELPDAQVTGWTKVTLKEVGFLLNTGWTLFFKSRPTMASFSFIFVFLYRKFK